MELITLLLLPFMLMSNTMKIQIRKSVFETNSSSTHSLQVCKSTINSARDTILQLIIERYKDNPYNIFNPKEYIDTENKTFTLKGLHIVDGEEQQDVYYIISNWIAKIQLIASELYGNAYYLEDYPKEKYGDSYYRTYRGDPYLTNTKIYKKFVELVQECLEKHGYDSMHVLNNIEYNIYEDSAKFPDSDKNYFKLLSNGKITLEEFEEFFNKVMKEDYIITYYDQAYTPFVKPEIYIL